jgi:rhamnogalacturonyl hydrolase YesR
MDNPKEKITNSIRILEKWIEEHDYKGYEPFDGLSSFLRPLTFGSLFADRLLLQLVRQSPVNIRPLLGIKPLESTKGRGYMAAGYLIRWKMTGDERYKEKAIACLDWLMQKKSPKFKEYSWANHFPFASRTGRYDSHESIIVWTALIGQAFLDGYDLIGDNRYLNVAQSACEWVMALPREKTDSGTCVSYWAFSQMSIHNSNMLGAALLARTAMIIGEKSYLQLAREAMDYSCTRQRPNGAWYYGETANQHWIDNFHTGYNLDSLKLYIACTGDKTYETNLQKGFQYFKNTFFEDSGRPKYYHDRTYPVDSQCIAQSIETLSLFAGVDKEALPLAIKVANWTIGNMQDPAGYFYYRQYPLGIKAKAPMLHWAQAVMYKAKIQLLCADEKENK